MQPKVVQSIMEINITVQRLTLILMWRMRSIRGKLGSLERLWRLLNWEKWTILGWCRHFSEVHILKYSNFPHRLVC